jgi:heme exporter protein D
MFQFDSFQALVAMGGHGFYVWISYGVSLAVMAWLVISPLKRKRQVLGNLKRQQRRTVADGRRTGEASY